MPSVHTRQSWLTTPPSGEVQINWAHPLAAGLRACWLLSDPAAGALKNIAALGQGDGTPSSVLPRVGSLGKGTDFNGTTSRLNLGSVPYLDDLSPLSIVAGFQADGWGENNRGRIICKGDGADSGFWGLLIGSDTTQRMTFLRDCATSDMAVRSATSSIALDTPYIGGISWDGTATAANQKLFINGTEPASYSEQLNGNGSVRSDAANSIAIGNDGTGSTSTFDGIIYFVMLWARYLGPETHRRIARDPYQLLSPAHSPSRFLIAAASGTTVTPAALTASLSVPASVPIVTQHPAAQTATASAPAPVPEVRIAPAALTATASVLAPTISLGGSITVQPAAQSLTASVQTPVPEVRLAPAAQSATASQPAAGVAARISAEAMELVLSQLAGVPGILVLPAGFGLTSSQPTPTEQVAPGVAALAATASVLAPTIGGGLVLNIVRMADVGMDGAQLANGALGGPDAGSEQLQ